MLIGITGALAIIPSILLVLFFNSRDAHPEPSPALWATFWFGVLSIIPTLMVALPVDWLMGQVLTDTAALSVSEAFLGAAIPEEFFKMTVLVAYASRHRAFDEPMDGVVYGVVASLGFATLENLLYSAQGVGVTIMRAFTAVPMHAFCGAVMGYYVGRARFPGDAPVSAPWLKAYLVPMAFHGLYDTPLLWFKRVSEAAEGPLSDAQTLAGLGAMGAALFVLIVLVIVGLILVAELRREQRRLIREGRFVIVEDLARGSVPIAKLAAEGSERAGARPAPEHVPNPALGSCLVVGGILSASFGGLVLLGCVAAFASGEVKPEDVLNMIVGGAVLSVPPLAVGLLLFVIGLRKFPRRQRRRSPYRAP